MYKRTIAEELALVKEQSEDGNLHPPDVVSYARENPESELYSRFEWDDTVAGEKFRLVQAGRLIRATVTTISNGKSQVLCRTFVNLETSPPDNGFHNTEDVLSDEEKRSQLIMRVLTQVHGILKTYPLPELNVIHQLVLKSMRKYRRDTVEV